MEGTRTCDSCYEVDKRIDDFVTSKPGLERALAAIGKSPEATGHGEASQIVAYLRATREVVVNGPARWLLDHVIGEIENGRHFR